MSPVSRSKLSPDATVRDIAPTTAPASGNPSREPGARQGRLRFVAIALVLAVTMAGATLASPLYPVYQHALGLSAGGITIAYTAYMLGALIALLFMGHVARHLGFSRTVSLGGFVLIAGLLASAFAGDLVLLALGRLVVGIAAGLVSTAATAGLVMLEPSRNKARASLTSSVATIAGLGLGPLVAGALAQWIPHPLVVPYVIVGVVASLGTLALWMLPADAGHLPARAFRPRPHMHIPASEVIASFALAALSAFIGYGLFGVFASLAPSFLDDLLPWKGPAVGGAGVALLFFGSTAAQLGFRNLLPRHGLTLGALLMTASLAMLATSLHFRSGALFVASDVVGGLGQGLGFMSALAVVNTIASDEHRPGMISSFFVAAYLGGVVPVLGLGFLANAIGLHTAVLFMSVGLGAVAVVLAGMVRRHMGATVATGPVASRRPS